AAEVVRELARTLNGLGLTLASRAVAEVRGLHAGELEDAARALGDAPGEPRIPASMWRRLASVHGRTLERLRAGDAAEVAAAVVSASGLPAATARAIVAHA